MKRDTAIKLCWSGAATCVVALVLLLSGCAYYDERPRMVRNAVSIIVLDNQDMPGRTLGTATRNGNTCIIRLREYPYCLQHEVRHCLEGNFHQGRKSGEDYFQ